MYSFVSFTAFAAFASTAISQDCFFPNGDLSGSDTACNPNSLVSTCCYDGQACLSNGLCVSDPHNTTLARLHRGTCTDQDWKSGNCPRHCLGISWNGVPAYSCNATGVDSYCCFDNCDCTSQWETFQFSDSVPYTITIIGEEYTQTQTETYSTFSTSPISQSSSTSPILQSTNSPTSNSPTTTTTSAPTNDAPKSQRKNAHSTAIGVGIGVGVGAALLIGGAVAFFIWRRSRRNTPKPYTNTSPDRYEVPANEILPKSQNGIQKYAYFEQPTTTELPVNAPPVELGDTQVRGNLRRPYT
ncbi:hypothetical protein P154DRAFT_519748 [Amniculicola lignicola CBS 123094]|uniref:Mid2 domain-containing protein n=1 Tax=Amniculicola lignicola CBS 123094 TaxID=1392246 RepID=A0A6A5WUE1_9PLEO|nr:hypothetical protein P154DRAFT_519748 [Amniculicola lignicola CBS 123094]